MDFLGIEVGDFEYSPPLSPAKAKVEQTLASYLSPSTASSLKAPTLPTKAYTAAVQAGACQHTMSILQVYQADMLRDQ